jgi:hypothetical protein
MNEDIDIDIRRLALQDELKAVIEKFNNETGKSVKNVHVVVSEGIAGDNGWDFSVFVELNQY